MTAVECPSCHLWVPAGSYCGRCGQPLTAPGSGRLRAATFAASPGEGVFRPALASSLFPHLPQRSRQPFRIGLAAIMLGLAGFAALRFSPGLVALAAVGPLLLFLLYLGASQVRRDLPRFAVILAVGLGAGLAVAWMLLTNRAAGWAVFTDIFRGWATYGHYETPMAIAGGAITRDAVAAVVSGALLMSLPAVAVRVLPQRTREALDGFVVGVVGALGFTAAATLIRLAPQSTTGTREYARPLSSFAVEAGINGVVIPLAAAAGGGVIGVALWFSPRREPRSRARRALWALSAAVLAAYVGIGLVEGARLPQIVILTLDLLLALACLLVLRVAVQVGLLHEEPDPISGEPLLCEHCEHVAPDAAYCAACGAATRASSKESRRLRRRTRPVPVGGEGS